MRRLVLSMMVSLLLPVYAFGEGRHAFNHYGVENGMSHSSVEAVIQDRFGFMWLGTGNGLNKFDGHSFRSYGNSHVSSLFEAPDGTIWVGTYSGIICFDPLSETSSVFNLQTPEGTEINGEVTCMKADPDGILWIGTAAEGLFRYDMAERQLSRISALNVGPSVPEIHDILPESKGVIFLATSLGLVRYEIRWNRPTFFPVPGVKNQNVVCLAEDDNDSIVLGCRDDGVFRYDRSTGTIEQCAPELGRIPYPRRILKVKKEELWIGTESGLYIYNEKEHTLDQFSQNISERTALSSNAVRSLCEDREGGVWIGTYLGGVNYTSTEQNFITQFTPSIAQGAIHGFVIKDFVEDSDGNLWIGTEDSGLYLYDRKGRTFTQWNMDNGRLPWHCVSALMLDSDKLYIAMPMHGICVLDVRSGKMQYPPVNVLFPDTIHSLFKDSRGRILAGVKDGLRQLNPENLTFNEIPSMNIGAAVYDIIEDHQKYLWFATYGNGLCSYDPNSGIWNRFRKGESLNSLSSDKVISITETSQGHLWIGTEDAGACILDPSTEEFKRYGTEFGLPSSTVYKVLEDKDGNVWFSTGKGLTRMSAGTESTITYSYNYGAPADQFNYKSGIKTRDGKLYFGTVRGFMEVAPEDLHTVYDPPKVVFTGWSVPGAEYSLEPSETILPGLVLKHNQTNVTFRYAALSYTAPQNNKYAYRLRGLDKEWIYTKSTSITYSRIPPGKYYLEVSGSNGDGVWSQKPTSIRLVVRPPFYASWPGILIEGLLAGLVLISVFVSQRKRMQQKNRLEIERVREAEAIATQKSRIDFFTSIIHEIRTPLSLIKAPFDQIRTGNLTEEDREEDMNMIEANIDRLMLLSNEILDFSRVEGNAFHLRPRLTQVNSLAEEVARNFSFAIKERGVSIEKELPENPVSACVDPEILIKILTNLFANATKYAEKKIVFRMEDLTDRIEFRISNDGPLVPQEARSRVFDAFYREERDKSTPGTGLGLPLVKKLAEIHKGTVCFEDEDRMNTLVVVIPKLETAGGEESDSGEEPSLIESNPDKRTIAIVDDDLFIRQYLNRTLSKKYNVLCCSDAKGLLDILKDTMVDLVISDIMMPQTDGIQLCHSLKSSFEYSQIPVILLSAKVDNEVKMQGMGAEADAFIEKPFTIDYVCKQIENVFTRLERMRDYYTKSPDLVGIELQGNPSDQTFMENICDLITEHMSEEDFSIDKIADIVGMSRSTLYRKIRGITQLSPGELIKVVRLKKAAQMLRSGSYRVNEVGFLVGFSSMSYFSTCFHKQFGQSPKEYKMGGSGNPVLNDHL